jgi:hypothetical protein
MFLVIAKPCQKQTCRPSQLIVVEASTTTYLPYFKVQGVL